MNRRRMLVTELSGGAAPTYTISGVVYDADGTTAVADATVALGAFSAVSAADGTYTISDIPAGTSGSMTCTKTGYSWTAIAIAAMSDNLTAQNYTNAWWALGGIGAGAVAAYRAVGAASQAASLVNLANPGTYDLTSAAPPTWNAITGWKGNGTSQFYDTGILPVLDNADWTMVVRFNTVTNQGVLCGCSDAGGAWRFYIWPNRAATDVSCAHGANNLTTTAPPHLDGTLAFAGKTAYRDGVEDATIPAGTYAPDTDQSVILFGRKYGGSVNDFLNAYVTEFAVYNTKLTGPQVAAWHGL